MRKIIAAACMAFLFLVCCKTVNHSRNFENKNTVIELYKNYADGEISECRYNGQIFYSAGLNAHDAASYIYDKDGKEIASCNYAWGNVDSLCMRLTDCEVIYRVRNNIWGEPAVDKYGLNRMRIFKNYK